jgi:hypothetical protein
MRGAGLRAAWRLLNARAIMMRKLSVLLPMFASLCVGACNPAEKPEPFSPDYGAEDAKYDSAQAPASIYDLPLNEVGYANFSSRSQYRAFRFNGKKGQKITAYVDGLKDLDTVAWLYRVSATTRKPYGKALAYNDDTRVEGWTVRTNTVPNPYSSSIVDFVLPETRAYALVASTYDGSTGKAEVVIKSQDGKQQCSGLIAYPECPSDMYCAVPDNTCNGADLPGYCEPRPQFCLEIYSPVCGCDGKTYGNDCERKGAGVPLDHTGVCSLSLQELDDAARAHVYGAAANQRIFANEAEAANWAQSTGSDERWLARDGEDLGSLHYIQGRNDLWAERFIVDKQTADVTITGEH